jgi:hypothetical protein
MLPLALLAQVGALTVAQWAIVIIVIAGIVGIVMVIMRQAGVAIPPFIVTVLWIILAVVVGVVAIKFLVGFV